MEPTMESGNIVLIKKYNFKISYNDIVVIKKNNKLIIKRVIGIPGDKIEIKDYVYVNDKKFDEILTKDSGDCNNKICLKKAEYFVLGDNREDSIDSRYEEIGIILEEEIIGKVILK